jgi:tetratricopeptide (TPR) repeat protein
VELAVLLGLWDFGDLAGTELRLDAALRGASSVDQEILKTQIARAQGLQGRFGEANATLVALKGSAEPEVHARCLLEAGRLRCSAAHDPGSVSEQDRSEAKAGFWQAFEVARQAGLDYLAVDALHMIGICEQDSDSILGADRRAIDFMEQSGDPDAKRWEGSLYLNYGLALNGRGEFVAAEEAFERARVARERTGDASGERIARWMVGMNKRAAGDLTAALEIQLRLESEWDSVGEPDPYVYEELMILYGQLGDVDLAAKYGELLKAAWV